MKDHKTFNDFINQLLQLPFDHKEENKEIVGVIDGDVWCKIAPKVDDDLQTQILNSLLKLNT